MFLIQLYHHTKPLRVAFYSSLGLIPHPCRHQPSCSQYTQEAVAKYGTIRGLALGIKRLLTCHPFSAPLHHQPNHSRLLDQ